MAVAKMVNYFTVKSVELFSCLWSTSVHSQFLGSLTGINKSKKNLKLV